MLGIIMALILTITILLIIRTAISLTDTDIMDATTVHLIMPSGPKNNWATAEVKNNMTSEVVHVLMAGSSTAGGFLLLQYFPNNDINVAIASTKEAHKGDLSSLEHTIRYFVDQDSNTQNADKKQPNIRIDENAPYMIGGINLYTIPKELSVKFINELKTGSELKVKMYTVGGTEEILTVALKEFTEAFDGYIELCKHHQQGRSE